MSEEELELQVKQAVKTALKQLNYGITYDEDNYLEAHQRYKNTSITLRIEIMEGVVKIYNIEIRDFYTTILLESDRVYINLNNKTTLEYSYAGVYEDTPEYITIETNNVEEISKKVARVLNPTTLLKNIPRIVNQTIRNLGDIIAGSIFLPDAYD